MCVGMGKGVGYMGLVVYGMWGINKGKLSYDTKGEEEPLSSLSKVSYPLLLPNFNHPPSPLLPVLLLHSSLSFPSLALLVSDET